MAIIATYVEGHPQHGAIIDWSREVWVATEQYRNAMLAFILFDLADDEIPTAIDSFGPVSSVKLNGVVCDRVYQQAVVTTECTEVN